MTRKSRRPLSHSLRSKSFLSPLHKEKKRRRKARARVLSKRKNARAQIKGRARVSESRSKEGATLRQRSHVNSRPLVVVHPALLTSALLSSNDPSALPPTPPRLQSRCSLQNANCLFNKSSDSRPRLSLLENRFFPLESRSRFLRLRSDLLYHHYHARAVVRIYIYTRVVFRFPFIFARTCGRAAVKWLPAA